MSLILDGTNGLSDVDGTAAAPAIRGTDANTGIFFPAADTIAFAEGGAEAMRIDSSGNLLVGTTTAQTGAKLAVTGGIQGTITSGTAVASTSGTSIDFTSIPSWVKRLTCIFNGVSVNSSSPPIIQLGTSAGVVTSGYVNTAGTIATTNNTTRGTAFTTGISVTQNGSAGGYSYTGSIVFVTIGSNAWVASGVINNPGNPEVGITAGAVSLGGTFDRVRFTTINGTDTFDAGSVNIMYEG